MSVLSCCADEKIAGVLRLCDMLTGSSFSLYFLGFPYFALHFGALQVASCWTVHFGRFRWPQILQEAH